MDAREETDGYRLIVEETGSAPRTVHLTRRIARVGRGVDCDVSLRGAHVSKRHAEIHRRDEGVVVVVPRTGGGVWVNGSPCRERRLLEGDVITFGRRAGPRCVFQGRCCTRGTPAIEGPGNAVTLEIPTRQGLRHLAGFLEFSRLLGGHVPVDRVLQRAVDLAVRLTGAERGFLIAQDRQGALRFPVARRADQTSLDPATARVSETIVRRVLREGRSEIVSDVKEVPQLARAGSVVSLSLGAAAALPLFASHSLSGSGADEGAESQDAGVGVVGVLYLDSRRQWDRVSGIDLGLLDALAHDLSTVLDNTRLLREAAKKERIEQEMERAREFQTTLLPQSFWDEPWFEIAGRCVPCRWIAGDYLDQIRLPDGRCGLVVADVSGKGMPAALLAAALQGALGVEWSTERAAAQDLGAMLGRINRAVCRLAPVGSFITAFVGILSARGELRFVNAGHCPGMIATREGRVRELTSGCIALGLDEHSGYRERNVQLETGEVLALFTDGVTEAVDPRGVLFGEARLKRILSSADPTAVASLLDSVIEQVEQHAANLAARDDVTLLVVRYRGV